MFQAIPQPSTYVRRLHDTNIRGANWQKDWRKEHELYIQHWQRRADVVFTSEPVPMCAHDYMAWFRRITMWIIGNAQLRPTQSFGHQPSGSTSDLLVRFN